MELLNQQILDCFHQSDTFALATILTNSGSTPRTSGSKMIVLPDKTIFGTIGGGLVEAMVMDASIDLIKKKQCAIKDFTLDQDLKEGLDMVCGGALSVLIETFMPASDISVEPYSDSKSGSVSHKKLDTKSTMANLFSALVDLENNGKKGFLVSKIQGFSKSDFTMQKCLVLPDGSIIGNNMLPKPLFDDILDNKFHGLAPIIHNHNLEEFIIEPIEPMDCIYIFGAGHVGFQLAKIARITDFQTIIIDDREEFANSERFPDSREVHAVSNFSKSFNNLEIDQNSYIVILTRGHLHDQTVLEGALKTDPAYIGMIGSRRKRNTIYENLTKKGISHETLEAVYSPIGIEIEAQTPGEIAVSIIGEIIKRKYSK
jgi:xanthine dehydrogenase accessory factor